MNVKEFPPVLYLFLLPSALGGIWLGPSFVLLGLIYWLIGTRFAKRGAVTFAVLFILIDIPLYLGAGMAAPMVIMFQIALILVFAIISGISKKVRSHNTSFDTDAKRRST